LEELKEGYKMYQNKSYLISILSGGAKKARTKTLESELKEIYDNEWITVYEDGKCIFDGRKVDFTF